MVNDEKYNYIMVIGLYFDQRELVRIKWGEPVDFKKIDCVR